jgi:hypothetical protein
MCMDCHHREDRMRTVQNIQEDTILEYAGINIPRIYATSKDRHTNHQSHMIKVESKISNHHVSILIDSREIHIYIDPKLVERFHLKRS